MRLSIWDNRVSISSAKVSRFARARSSVVEPSVVRSDSVSEWIASITYWRNGCSPAGLMPSSTSSSSSIWKSSRVTGFRGRVPEESGSAPVSVIWSKILASLRLSRLSRGVVITSRLLTTVGVGYRENGRRGSPRVLVSPRTCGRNAGLGTRTSNYYRLTKLFIEGNPIQTQTDRLRRDNF